MARTHAHRTTEDYPLDYAFLSSLSADAADEIAKLPPEHRRCLLDGARGRPVAGRAVVPVQSRPGPGAARWSIARRRASGEVLVQRGRRPEAQQAASVEVLLAPGQFGPDALRAAGRAQLVDDRPHDRDRVVAPPQQGHHPCPAQLGVVVDAVAGDPSRATGAAARAAPTPATPRCAPLPRPQPPRSGSRPGGDARWVPARRVATRRTRRARPRSRTRSRSSSAWLRSSAASAVATSPACTDRITVRARSQPCPSASRRTTRTAAACSGREDAVSRLRARRSAAARRPPRSCAPAARRRPRRGPRRSRGAGPRDRPYAWLRLSTHIELRPRAEARSTLP